MALIANVPWVCPGCGSKENAQICREWRDEFEYPYDKVPFHSGGVRWNPPCEKCGQYRLDDPDYISLVIKPVSANIEDK